MDVGHLLAVHVGDGELVAHGQQLADHLIDGLARLVHDLEGLSQGKYFLFQRELHNGRSLYMISVSPGLIKIPRGKT